MKSLFGRRKRALAVGVCVASACGVVAAAVYRAITGDPSPIKVNPAICDDYAGYYDFGRGYVMSIRYEADRLMAYVPERLPRELFAETETKFFFKGEPVRFVFHRNENGRVDHLMEHWKKYQNKAPKRTELPRPPAGTNGMVAATTGGAALQAGLDILKEGGTAADAAMATALAEVAHAAGAYVSFAGVMHMMYYEAASGRVHSMDACYNTPSEEKDPRSIPKTGGRTALVPGFMAGVQAAHDKFGKVPFKRLFDAAIKLAEEGRPVEGGLPYWFKEKEAVLSRFPETKKIFTRSDGQFYEQGDLFRQPELAATLRKVATQGASVMYDGEWGRKFVDVIRRTGGKITQQDMKQYRVIWDEPIKTAYHGYEVFAPGFSARGGVDAIESFNLLELANLKQWGHYTTEPRSLFWFMEIVGVQCVLAGRAEFRGRELSARSRVMKETSAWVWEQMQKGEWHYSPQESATAATEHSDGVVVVDQWGNMAAVTHSINTRLWGNTGIFVDGISIPDSAVFQKGWIARVGPGKRLPHTMSPLIITRAGRAVVGSSAIGSALLEKTMQVLVSILDFEIEPQTAVNTPAFQVRASTSGFAGEVGRGTYDPKTIDGVREIGLKVKVVSDPKRPGYWVGIQVDPETRRMKGAVSLGLEGVEGY